MMNKSKQLDSIVNRLVAASDPIEIQRIYADWAATYESDLDFFGYVAPRLATHLLHQALPDLSAEILDAGCGTGLVGQALTDLGYLTIDGCDFSAEMRAKAKLTGHYRHLQYANFLERLPQFADDSYDAITCVGVYSSTFHPQFLRELVRIVKRNGVVCLTCRPHYFEGDVQLQLNELVAAGQITIEALTHQPYMQGQGAEAAYIVLRKASD